MTLRKRDFDDVLQDIGGFGRAQMLFFVVICYGSAARACLGVAQVFLGKVPKFHCEGQPTEDPCKATCGQYIFDKSNFSSIVSEWALVCEDKEYVGLVQSAFMFGILLGNIFIGPLADQYGRKLTIVYGHIGMAAFHFAAAYSQSYLQFVIARFLVGLVAAGCITTTVVYVMENAPSNWRTMLNTIYGFFYGFGISLLALLAYFLREWRDLVLYSNVLLLGFICLLWFLPESPRWLASQGRLGEAEEILFYLGRRNGVTPVTYDMVSLRGMSNVASTNDVQKGSVLDGFRTREMRRRMLILMFIWMVSTMSYFGLTIGSSNLGGNMYITVALSGLIELPAKVIGGMISTRFGRRIAVTSCMMLCGVCCLAVIFLPRMQDGDMSSTQTTIAMIAKMGVSAAFNIIFLYTGELLPTVIRSSTFSFCSMTGRIAGIIGPLIASTLGDNIVFLIYGTTCIIAGIVSIYLPETLNQPLPDTVADVENQALQLTEKYKMKEN
ncbi:solute carrier family 22 member 15-like [Amphiura filiformis]|uniref:solute carrier family 22 member 15-like n=1 Tax=Amphiura filiformis TaxID=82378 RepID=UPI003B225D74